MTQAKSYEGTKVTVERSRAQIAEILEKWGALGIMWTDDLTTGSAVLRFRWPVDGGQLVARLRVDVDPKRLRRTDARVSVHKQRARERRRLHRVAYWWIKAQYNAVEAGLFEAETVVLPWLEDGQGVTVAESVRPHLAMLGTADVGRRLALPGGAS